MKPETAVKAKIAAFVGLGFVAVLAAASYFRTFDTAKDDERRLSGIAKRLETIRSIPIPEGTVGVGDAFNGRMEPYGINLDRRIVLDVTDASDLGAKGHLEERIQTHYADWLLDWHPGLTNKGTISSGRSAEGRAGLAVVETKEIWFEDVLAGRLDATVTELVRDAFSPDDGRGRRFVVVRILVCTRPK